MKHHDFIQDFANKIVKQIHREDLLNFETCLESKAKDHFIGCLVTAIVSRMEREI